MLKRIPLILVFLSYSQHGFSLESDFKQPIYFNAETSSFNHNQNIFSSQGNIRISQGTILIEASKAEGSLRNGQPYQINLYGSPVKFQQKTEKGMVYGRANSIMYNSTSAEIVLKGDSNIKLGDGSSLHSDIIRYNLTIGDIEAKGSPKNRVQIIIPPQQNLEFKPLKR